MKYEFVECPGSGYALIDLETPEFLGRQTPSEVVVAFRNLTNRARSAPIYYDEIELRMFIKIGDQWYTGECANDEELLQIRNAIWYRPGITGRQNGGERTPNPPNDWQHFDPSQNNNNIEWNAANVSRLPNEYNNLFLTKYVWLNHYYNGAVYTYESELHYYGRGEYAFRIMAGEINVLPLDLQFEHSLRRRRLRVGTVRVYACVEYYDNRRQLRWCCSNHPNPWCNSPDRLAVRISVRDAVDDYVSWMTSFVGVPYEWGGGWYGGRADGQDDPGTGDHGYGIDCNGIVWAAQNLHRAGFLRRDTSGLYSISDEQTLDTAQRGDWFIRRREDTLDNDSPGHIFVIYSISHPDQNSEERRNQVAYIRTVEAIGGTIRRVRVSDELRVVRETDDKGRPYYIFQRRSLDGNGWVVAKEFGGPYYRLRRYNRR